MLEQTKLRDAAWFNLDENFRSSWNAALDLKNECVAKWWLPVLLDSKDNISFHKLLQQLRNQLTKDIFDGVAVEAAKQQGLIKTLPNEFSGDGDKSVLMQCAASGNESGVRLLIAASADVLYKDKVLKIKLKSELICCGKRGNQVSGAIITSCIQFRTEILCFIIVSSPGHFPSKTTLPFKDQLMIKTEEKLLHLL